MSTDGRRRQLFGRRQLLLGGGTFLAGMAGVALWAETRLTSRTASSATNTAPGTKSPTTRAPAASQSTVTQTSITTPATTTPETSTTAISTTEISTTDVSSTAVHQVVTGPATYVDHGPTTVNNVALTFHLGGDATLVGELLDLLKASGTASTLFAIGDWLTANPELGHRAVDDGHELGNHTKSHKSMLKLSRAAVRDEIVGGGEALVPFIGSIGKWFRPSGTDVPTALILEEAGLAGYAVSVGYDIDSLDYTEPGANAVVARVKKQLHVGAIVSLHFGHRDTIQAMPKILDLLTTAGLAPVTVSTLLQ